MGGKKLAVLSVLLLLVLPVMLASLVLAANNISWGDLGGPGVIKFLQYIFGSIPTGITDNAISAAVVTIAVWLMVVFTFGDIFANFTTFSKPVAWIVGLLVGIIAANINLNVVIIAGLVSMLAWAGTLAVWLALGAAFLAFIVVNLGLSKFAPWIMRRKAMMAAAESEAGGTKLAGTIKGLGAAGKALSKI